MSISWRIRSDPLRENLQKQSWCEPRAGRFANGGTPDGIRDLPIDRGSTASELEPAAFEQTIVDLAAEEFKSGASFASGHRGRLAATRLE